MNTLIKSDGKNTSGKSGFIDVLIKLDHIIENVQTYICVLLFIIILVLGSVQIFGRYLFHYSTPWSEELMRFSGIWLAMIGSSLTIRVDGHVSVDILLSYMKDNKKRAILFVVARLICVIFLIWYLPASITMILKSKTSMAASIPMPYAYVYLAVPVGIVMMLISYASTIPNYMKKYMKGEK
ncbi:MAG: TRAP transporter small permease [Thermotaleaceae bacterium]